MACCRGAVGFCSLNVSHFPRTQVLLLIITPPGTLRTQQVEVTRECVCLCVCAGMCVYLWLWPLLLRCDPLLHFAEQPQQEVVTSDLAFAGGVKVLQTGGTGSEETA